MDNTSFWLNCCQSSKAHKVLRHHSYNHDPIKHGDLGGIKARISGKFFEWDRDGDFYIAQAVWREAPSLNNPVEFPILYDIIAWQPDSPHQWYFLRGEAGLVLGEKSLSRANLIDEPLRLHSTPMAWLKSGCKGSVLLDHYGLGKLYGLQNIICENIEHGTRLERDLSM
jgi:hypothetical protein